VSDGHLESQSQNGALTRDPPTSIQAAGDAGLESEQTLSETDQTLSDADQTHSDADQQAADTDQAQADIDQDASDRDQNASDRELSGAPTGSARRRAHDISSEERRAGSLARDATWRERARAASDRAAGAVHRDEAAHLRDLTAAARDRAGEARDRAWRRREERRGALTKLERALQEVTHTRAQAAADRARAAADRAQAARDREQAAHDRQRARAELRHAHLDDLTGAYGRALGTHALQGEIDRARREGKPLVLAFVDVDGLKGVNDRHGHAAGDALLRDVVAAIRSDLRAYDPIVRVGGDEFVCALTNSDLERARARFEAIQADLECRRIDGSVSVGLAALEADDTLDDLTRRGDAALHEARCE
jgi:diguanylate cyclase (GGDEF)-like protein